MAAIAAGGLVSELQRAQIDLLRAQLAFASSRGTEATSLLLAAGRRLEGLDVRLARETYLDAFAAALYGGRQNDTDSVDEVAQAARALASLENAEADAADLLLIAFVALADDYAAAVPRCRAALDKLLTYPTVSERQLRWLSVGLLIALELWDDERAYALSNLYLQTARESGALSELELALGTHTHMLVLSGQLSAAESLVAEGQSIREATGISGFQYGAIIASAWHGKNRELIEAAIREAEARGQAFVTAGAHCALAVLCNSLGLYEEGRIAGSVASKHERPIIENYGLPEVIESATRTGRIDLASAALDRLTTKTQASGTDWALGIEARSRALLNDGDLAEHLFREAIARLGRTRARAELARAQLLFGEWLRREGRRAEAREHLRLAHEALAAMGIAAFAERAQQELAATGEKVRKRVEQARNELTAQELHVARMAFEGLSNIDIAARLFLSPRTVEWHLGKVFIKLGIKTRAQLHLALPAASATAST
jgi:DNA-binding CsgD family transcriptional regulator